MKKKYPRLPNGWGSIRDLGKGRTNRFAVHPPSSVQQKKRGNAHFIGISPLCCDYLVTVGSCSNLSMISLFYFVKKSPNKKAKC